MKKWGRNRILGLALAALLSFSGCWKNSNVEMRELTAQAETMHTVAETQQVLPVSIEDRNADITEAEDGTQTITIACLQSDGLLRCAVSLFNEEDLGIRAELKVYYDRMQADESPEDLLQKLHEDILNGTAGDIVCFNGLEAIASRQQYAESGVFADLNQWMDADETFRRADYFSSIWEANEIEGKLINLVPLFSLNTMIADKEQADSIPSLEDVVEQTPEQMKKMFGTGYLRSVFLHDLCLYLLDEPENAASLLYDPYRLAHYLEAAGELPETDESEGNDDIVNIHIGRQLLYRTYGSYAEGMGRFLQQLRIASAFFKKEDVDPEGDWHIYDWGTEVSCVGLPIRSGDGSSVRNLISFGMQEGSQKQEAAWEFLKFTLQETYQKGNENYQYYTMPVNRSVFYGILEEIERDSKIDPLHQSGIGSGIMEEDIAVFAPMPFMSQWMLEETERLIGGITHVDETDPVIERIVQEGLQQYLSGVMSSVEAAQQIGEQVHRTIEE